MLASDLLGRLALGRDGRPIGRVVDLLCSIAPDGAVVVDRVAVSKRRLRLFSFDREELQRPWIVAFVARRIQGKVELYRIGDLSFADDTRSARPGRPWHP